ncbi:MAG: HAMP domain-containing histidine kinase [Lachnospiraceae bacterium]|nr:HAMP domain-containing histidine kinase [Lachnospiraceae bacterium]
MKRHCTFGKKSLVIAVEMLSVLGIIGIITFMYTRCIVVTNNKNYSFLINPFENDHYEDSDSLADMFSNDSADMVYYLALCQQFETIGKFDKEKTIDLLEYYYRKQPGSKKVSSNGELVYKVQDLINWGNAYGVDVQNGMVEEKYYPVDGESIYQKDLVTILENALPNGILEFEQIEQANITVSVEIEDTSVANEEDIVESVSEEISVINENDFSSEAEALDYLRLFIDNSIGIDGLSLEECQRGMKAVNYLKEAGWFDEKLIEEINSQSQLMAEQEFDGTEKEFLYQIVNKVAAMYIEVDRDAYQEQTYRVFAEILSSVISDLKINYEKYQDYRDYFVINNLNFKYLYLPEKGNDYYTNLEMEKISQAKEQLAYFNEELAACVVIEPTTKNVKEKSTNVRVDSLFQMLDTVGYSFQKSGGTIYLGVLKDSIPGFAEYDENDHYATAQRAYKNFRSEFKFYLILVGILLIMAIVSFVIYSCMCGHKAWYEVIEEDGMERRKLMVAEKPVGMKYFDGLFTEIAFAIGAALLTGMVIGSVGGVKYLAESENALYIIKNWLVLVALLTYTGIFNGICLFVYGSLIRRIKTGTLWKGSLCAFLLGKISLLFSKMKKGITEVYYNRGIIFKICLFYIPAILINFLLIMLGTEFAENYDMEMCFLMYLMALVGSGVFLYFIYKNNLKHQEIIDGIEKINGGEFGFQLNTEQMKGDNLRLAEAVNHIGTGIKQAVETSMKDERLKADLITNVSHDIKTPLTSIINYVDLLKRENVQNDTVREYIEVLDAKSQRLKQLTEDLVEASKISSGNITLIFEKLHVVELMNQIIGEFSEKFQEKHLDVIANFMDKDAVILADGRRMCRVFENLFGNIYKYAMPGTRVYVEVYQMSGKIYTAIKNISMQPLNIDAEELTERFIRGDISRSTEGSGLGLSIAKSLVTAQEGEFKIYLDGDLFKVTIVFRQEKEESLTE